MQEGMVTFYYKLPRKWVAVVHAWVFMTRNGQNNRCEEEERETWNPATYNTHREKTSPCVEETLTAHVSNIWCTGAVQHSHKGSQSTGHCKYNKNTEEVG